MICPYCGRYNADNAVYCEGCGRPLKEKSSSNFSSDNKFLIIMGGILLLVILSIGVGTLLGNSSNTAVNNSTNSSNITPTQSYSDGKISFNYPNDFFNTTDLENGTGWVDLGNYENSGGTGIGIQRTTDKWAAAEARKDYEFDSNTTSNIISQTTETNPNGITVYKNIYTVKYPDNTTDKDIELYFNDKKGLVYYICIYDTESNYQAVSDTANIIFNSLKLS